jgi:hypothetical protein
MQERDIIYDGLTAATVYLFVNGWLVGFSGFGAPASCEWTEWTAALGSSNEK